LKSILLLCRSTISQHR